MQRTLVLYTFFERNECVDYFVKHGIYESPDTDFVFICNDLKLQLPDLPDYVLYINRQNIGFDFGGWSEGLYECCRQSSSSSYTHFIFVNASVFGPFLPPYFRSRWTDIFVDALKRDPEVWLYGCTMNGQPLLHVQSYVFAMDWKTMELLTMKGIFSTTSYEPTKKAAITNREVRMSQEILRNGGQIGCLMKYYERSRKNPPLGDVLFPNRFFGQSLHPFEIIFIKGNRKFSRSWLRQYMA